MFIFLEFGNSDKDVKGFGFWKMNCLFLEDEDYIREVIVKIFIWLIEGCNELIDNRSIWVIGLNIILEFMLLGIWNKKWWKEKKKKLIFKGNLKK